MNGPMQILDRERPPKVTGSDVSIKDLPQDSLEDLLLLMVRWGKPRLSKQSDGWYCAVDVTVNAKGVEFKVQSDFDHESPFHAASDCHARLMVALKGLGVQA